MSLDKFRRNGKLEAESSRALEERGLVPSFSSSPIIRNAKRAGPYLRKVWIVVPADRA